MKDLQNRIQQMLREKKTHSRAVALITALSLLMMIIVPDLSAIPGAAATPDNVPSGAYSIENDIHDVVITSINNCTASGGTVTAIQNADNVEFSMKVNFVIQDQTHDKIDTSKPYIYLPVSKEELNIFLATGAPNQGDSEDDSPGWTKYCQDHQIGSSTGTYHIYPTEDGDYGYVVIEFNLNYIAYVKSSNGIVTGSLQFSGAVNRDAAQNGDKTIKVGNAEIKIDFDDREPKLDKSVSSASDSMGCPELTWTIAVEDLYETGKYQITDDMLSEAYDFSTNPTGICYLEDGQIKFNDAVNTVKNFTITYKTKITPEQLKDKTEAFTVTNEVKLNDVVKDTAEIEITPDSAPHVTKTGTPDYNYSGDRSGEDPEKNYIYWDVTVYRNYGLSLAGYTLNDTLSEKLQNLTMLRAEERSGETIPLDSLFADTSGTSWTFKSDVDATYVKLYYRTEVTADAEGIKNKIQINNDGDSDTPSINYNKNAQHKSDKWGVYVSEEDANGNPVEYIDWTIEIKAEDGTYETINNYSVFDSAFDTADLQWISVEAKNDGAAVPIQPDGAFTGTGTTRKIVLSPQMDYLKVTYRVPVGEIAGRSETKGGTAINSYGVEKDEPETAEVTVPSLAGETTVNVNKYWNNTEDTEKDKVHATFTLYYKVEGETEWHLYSDLKPGEGTITVDGTQSGMQSFKNLPTYKIENGARKPYYYKVEETMATDAGVVNRYKQEMTSGNANGMTTNSRISMHSNLLPANRTRSTGHGCSQRMNRVRSMCMG